jgi:hypothetical protein
MNDAAFTHDIFLIRSSKDKTVVRAVAERLRADGLRVWFEEWEIPVAASRQSAAIVGQHNSAVLSRDAATPSFMVPRCFQWNRQVVSGHDTGKTVS